MSTINTKFFATFVLMGGALVAQAEESTGTSPTDNNVESFFLYNDGGVNVHTPNAHLSLSEFSIKTSTGLTGTDALLFNNQGNNQGGLGQTTSYLCPNFDFKNGGNAPSWTLTYKLTNQGPNDIAVGSITVITMGMTKAPNTTEVGASGIPIKATITLQYGTTTQNTTVTNTGTGIAGTGGGTTDFELDTFNLGVGDSIFLKVTISDPEYQPENEQEEPDNLYMGVKGFDFNGCKYTPTGSVPEPTSATLSLLALAGLAARRRRK